MWDRWKKSFDKWEDTTARHLEKWLESPLVLTPSGALLSAVMKARAASQQMKARLWAELGLPTRRDQERTLHLLEQLQSRLLDLEEKLEEKLEDRNDARSRASNKNV